MEICKPPVNEPIRSYQIHHLNMIIHRFGDGGPEAREIHEFQNEYFIRGQPHLLNNLKRNVGIRRSRDLAVKRRLQVNMTCFYSSFPFNSVFEYRILRNKRYRLINAPPVFWGSWEWPLATKIAITSLIIDQFSIWNHRWKAQNLSYPAMNSNIALRMHRCVYYTEYGKSNNNVTKDVGHLPAMDQMWRFLYI